MKRYLMAALGGLILLAVATVAFGQSTATGASRGGGVRAVTVTINVTPQGAQVTIDKTTLAAPATFQLAPGTYNVSLQAANYRPQTMALTVDAARGAAQTFNYALTPMTFRLTVRTNVQQATITIDRVAQKGAIPWTGQLAPGVHAVAVSAPGYQDFSQNVNLDRDTIIDAVLQPAVFRLSVQSPVRDAVVTVNGAAKGALPYVEPLAVGTYQIVVSARGYLDFAQTVRLERDTAVNAILQAATYRLAVQSPVKDAVVTVNGTAKGALPYVEALAMGTYQIVVSARGYNNYMQTVTLDRDTVVAANLTPAMAVLVLPAQYLEGQVQVLKFYLDGKLVNASQAARGNLEIPAGRHVVRLASVPSGLAVEGEMVFEAGVQYEMRPLLQFVAAGQR